MARVCSTTFCTSTHTWACLHCDLSWCINHLQWDGDRSPICRLCDNVIFEHILEDALAPTQVPVQTPDPRPMVIQVYDGLHVYFCSTCHGFQTSQDEVQWLVCEQCSTMSFRCSTQLMCIKCHLCGHEFPTIEEFQAHMPLNHRVP